VLNPSFCVTDPTDYVPEYKEQASGAVDPLPGPQDSLPRPTSREIVDELIALQFVGVVSPIKESSNDPRVSALLVPRGIALDELNVDRKEPITDKELTQALKDLRIVDYPHRAPKMGGQLQKQPEQVPMTPLLPEGSYEKPCKLDWYADGYPRLPGFLKRRTT
jgi:hypothetical protein